MSWLYSQTLVEEYLGENFSDGEQSVQLSGKPTQQVYCAPDKMTDFSRLSRYGMTYKPLTENLGEELLTLYLEAFHAKICQPLEVEQVLTEKDQDFGEKWGGLLARLDPDTFLWKTPQCSLIMDSTECLETFPNWGMMQNGVLWEQTSLVHPIDGTDFGWWPTPVASDWMGGQTNGIQYTGKRFVRTSLTTGTEFGTGLKSAYRLMTGNHLPPNFSEWMMGWPINWTELKPVETDKSQSVQQQLGES